ncbi:MAG: biotin--[acetyl-CoA-carboxylase] ligase [Chloroflexaceae bacterium]|nr:biotin--[acetyl-CoA-carboxylase] ligase [Chloroflexaceae bacterium]
MDDDDLTHEPLLAQLHTSMLPRRVEWYPEVGSTMDIARERLKQHDPQHIPLLVLTDVQTSGRGRRGRAWITPPGSALLFSLALRPDWLPPARVVTLVWMTGVAVCEAITATTGLPARLKWPNDVLLRVGSHDSTAKIGGIILESSCSASFTTSGENRAPTLISHIVWAIIGCGLNINTSPPIDMGLRYPATCLAEQLGRPVPRRPLMRMILQRMDHWYSQLYADKADELFETWRGLLVTLGQTVEVETEQGTIRGRAEDVGRDGRLHVRHHSGEIYMLSSGDVSGVRTRASL